VLCNESAARIPAVADVERARLETMKFRFEAFDASGELVRGQLEAATLVEAQDIVRARGVTPYVVRRSRSRSPLSWHHRSFSGHQRLPNDRVARLTRDLAVLLDAGVPLEPALAIATASAEGETMRGVAQELREGIRHGKALGDVMAAMGDAFGPDIISIVRAGETGADLAGALKELADLLDRRVEVRNRIRSALTYPAILIGLAAVSLWIVLWLLIPAVTPIFRENGVPLPAVIAALDGVREQAGSILAGAGAFAAIAWIAYRVGRRSHILMVGFDGLCLRLPVIGAVLEARNAARFTRTLAALLRAGMGPLQALEAASNVVSNRFLGQRLDQVIADVRAGVAIGGAVLARGALPVAVQQIITVGEESGRLPDMLLRAAALLDRLDQIKTGRALAVVTPAVTVLIAGLVAAVILSVMSAILSLNDLVLR
jgi:general secretion pathway protein F